MLYGRTVRGPPQLLNELWTKEVPQETRSTYRYILDVRNRLEETCQLARESLLEARVVHKHHYDKGAKGRTFEAGEKALVLLPTDRNKLLLQCRGPYEITQVISGRDYSVTVNGREKLFHANLLKRYVTRGEANVGDQDHESEPAMQKTESVGAAVLEPVNNVDGVVNN